MAFRSGSVNDKVCLEVSEVLGLINELSNLRQQIEKVFWIEIETRGLAHAQLTKIIDLLIEHTNRSAARPQAGETGEASG